MSFEYSFRKACLLSRPVHSYNSSILQYGLVSTLRSSRKSLLKQWDASLSLPQSENTRSKPWLWVTGNVSTRKDGLQYHLVQVKMALQRLPWKLNPTEYLMERGTHPVPDIISTIMEHNP